MRAARLITCATRSPHHDLSRQKHVVKEKVFGERAKVARLLIQWPSHPDEQSYNTTLSTKPPRSRMRAGRRRASPRTVCRTNGLVAWSIKSIRGARDSCSPADTVTVSSRQSIVQQSSEHETAAFAHESSCDHFHSNYLSRGRTERVLGPVFGAPG